MLGANADVTTSADSEHADAVRSIRDTLDGIVRALSSLRDEIDRALVERPASNDDTQNI